MRVPQEKAMQVAGADKTPMKPVYALRALLGLVLVVLLAAFAVSRPDAHAMLLGGAVGLMIGAFLLSFQLKSVELKDAEQAADVGSYRMNG